VADYDNRATVERYAHSMGLNDLDTFEATLHPDVEVTYPQSGERFRGRGNVRAHLEHYPGRERRGFDASFERVIGDEAGWVMSPSFTAIQVEGAGEHFTTVGRVRYPTAPEPWHVVSLVEVHDGLIRNIAVYFAEPFEAPEWRASYREPTEA
jgi:hypothetical protein